MKTINQFRWTNKFCISGADMEQLTRLGNYFCRENGYTLVAVANDDEPCKYTVRVITKEGAAVDMRVELYGTTPRVVEQAVIVPGAAA